MLGDARFAFASRAPVTPTVLVAIDARSLSAIDVWPWPRARHAELIERLGAMGAAEIHFDIDFSSPSDPANDRALADALARSPTPVTLAAHAQATQAGLVERLPLPPFAAHAGTASVVVRAGPDGLVRRAERGRLLGGMPTPSLATLVADLPPAPGSFAIDFSIDGAAVPVVSFVDVLAGTVDPATIEGARVVVGATAVELGDMLAVPHRGILPGALVQVIAGETLAQDRVPAPVPHALAVGLALALALGLAMLALMARGGALGAGPALAGVAAATGALALLDAHLFVCHALVLPSVEIGLAHLATTMCVVLTEIVRRRLREAAARREAENAARVLDRVVADNFDGILVYDEAGRVLSISAVARRLMRDVLAIDSDREDVLTGGLTDAVHDRLALPARLLREGRWKARPPTSQRFTDVHGRARHLEYVLTPSWTTPAEGTRSEIVTTLTLRDVTERVASRERMDWLARHDEPTGALKPHALAALLDARPGHATSRSALVAFDLRRFAVVRRTLGRGRSDRLLARVVERVDALPGARGVARTADGEFVAWIRTDGEPSDDGPHAAARAVRAAVREGLGATASAARMAIPTGVLALDDAPAGEGRAPDGGEGRAPDGGGDLGPDGRRAIEAVVTAKEVAVARGDAIVAHEPAMDEAARRRLTLEADLPAAIAEGGLSIAYQPQVDLETDRTVGVEALARWIHPTLGFVPPDEFIEVAEAEGRIADLGAWILSRACAEVARLNAGLDVPLRVAVNVSPQQFIQSDVGAAVEAALDASGLPPSLLELEITESLAVNDPGVVTETLAPWRARGVRVALDDFGTGYAQLGALGDLPLDKIKLDRSLVAPLPAMGATSLVAAALTIAGGHGLTTVAEGIEDERIATLLRGAGCHIGQGYHWSRPLGIEALREWLGERKGRAATA